MSHACLVSNPDRRRLRQKQATRAVLPLELNESKSRAKKMGG
jgi:hypothetical protein